MRVLDLSEEDLRPFRVGRDGDITGGPGGCSASAAGGATAAGNAAARAAAAAAANTAATGAARRYRHDADSPANWNSANA